MKENKLIVGDSAWAESIPEWLLTEIRGERMVNGMCSIVSDGKESIGDAELVAYLMTASNRAPLDHNTAQIYLHLTCKLMIRCKKFDKNNVPDFLEEINKTGINSDQERELEILKSDLIRKRGKVNHPLFDMLKKLQGGLK